MKIQAETPLSTNFIKNLSLGDEVYLTGEIVTIRDMGCARAINYKLKNKMLPVKLYEAVIYHCGPIVKKVRGEWKVVAAGPTTSMRMNHSTPQLIKLFKIKMIIGKGGMGLETASALKEHGVYCAFTGGAGVAAAKMIKKIVKVEWLDLGVPEALWVFKVENFGPLIVAIDSKGNNLYEKVKLKVDENLRRILK